LQRRILTRARPVRDRQDFLCPEGGRTTYMLSTSRPTSSFPIPRSDSRGEHLIYSQTHYTEVVPRSCRDSRLKVSEQSTFPVRSQSRTLRSVLLFPGLSSGPPLPCSTAPCPPFPQPLPQLRNRRPRLLVPKPDAVPSDSRDTMVLPTVIPRLMPETGTTLANTMPSYIRYRAPRRHISRLGASSWPGAEWESIVSSVSPKS
jgi:hypothetical protein